MVYRMTGKVVYPELQDVQESLNQKTIMNINEELNKYFESIGLHEVGQYEWINKEGWTIEYMGTNEKPDCWRIDNFENGGHQILFLNLKNKEELEWILKSVIEI